MFYENNNTAKLLDMEDIIVKSVENNGEEVHVFIELPRKTQICPRCRTETNRVHDYREQKIKDIPFGRTIYLHLRKRRYCCEHCGKRFSEENTLVPRLKCTPFVRQYGILFRKWGVFVCQRDNESTTERRR